jgi:hypothetical protein
MLELLDLIIGIVFGFVHKGKEDYTGLLRNSAISGLVMGIVFVLLSAVFFPEKASIIGGFTGIFGIFVLIITYVIIFIIGAFIGDVIENKIKR